MLFVVSSVGIPICFSRARLAILLVQRYFGHSNAFS